MFVCLQLIPAEQSGTHNFRMTGPGADQDPKGLFTIDIHTGDVSVSRSLDREAIDSYQVSVCVCLRMPLLELVLIVFVCMVFSLLSVHLGALSFTASTTHLLFACQFHCSCSSVPVLFADYFLFISVKLFMRICSLDIIYFDQSLSNLAYVGRSG